MSLRSDKVQVLRCHLCSARGCEVVFELSTPRQHDEGKRVVVRDPDSAATYGIAVGSAVNLCPHHAKAYDAAGSATSGRSTIYSAGERLRRAAEQ